MAELIWWLAGAVALGVALLAATELWLARTRDEPEPPIAPPFRAPLLAGETASVGEALPQPLAS